MVVLCWGDEHWAWLSIQWNRTRVWEHSSNILNLLLYDHIQLHFGANNSQGKVYLEDRWNRSFPYQFWKRNGFVPATKRIAKV